jgi:hypothetical protein
VSGDDTADDGVTVGMGGGTKCGGVSTYSTISAATIGAFSELVSDSEPLVEPGSFFFITSGYIIYDEGFIHRKGARVSGCIVPRAVVTRGHWDPLQFVEVGVESASGLGCMESFSEG